MLGSRASNARSRARTAGARPTRQARDRQPARRKTTSAATATLLSQRLRPLLLLFAMIACAGGLISRLVFWQVMQHGHLSAIATSQRAALKVEVPLRGQIFDARGNPLATDMPMNLVYAVPKHIKDPQRTARLVAPVLGQDSGHMEALLANGQSYVLLAPRVSARVSQALRNLALPGIILDPQIRRDYPEASQASQIVGFATNDNKGYWGLEGYYDKLLSGSAGLRSIMRDTAGNTIHLSSQPALPSRNGADLHLSLDSVIQGLVEDELKKAVTQHSATGGSIIVMDPRTGYILGMASTPTFNPNKYWQADTNTYANPAIGSLYEPGSTFKIFTMAAGLDTGVITPDTSFYDSGVFSVADIVIHNWSGSGFGQETMTQVLQHSANVGASFVAQRLGTERFYEYMKRFQLGQPTGVDLQGEQSGLLPMPGSSNWTIGTLFTNSFGQVESLTPLQVIRGVAAVANGGVMMKPQIVKQIVYDGRIIDRPPVVAGRVISAQTAHTLTKMLVESAIGGEAELGLVKGYDIAAKTGTANIPGPDGKYIPNATIASIVGYAPAYHPRFVVLVKIDRPRDTPWGSMAAAPVLHDLFQELFMYFHIPPAANALYK